MKVRVKKILFESQEAWVIQTSCSWPFGWTTLKDYHLDIIAYDSKESAMEEARNYLKTHLERKKAKKDFKHETTEINDQSLYFQKYRD